MAMPQHSDPMLAGGGNGQGVMLDATWRTRLTVKHAAKSMTLSRRQTLGSAVRLPPDWLGDYEAGKPPHWTQDPAEKPATLCASVRPRIFKVLAALLDTMPQLVCDSASDREGGLDDSCLIRPSEATQQTIYRRKHQRRALTHRYGKCLWLHKIQDRGTRCVLSARETLGPPWLLSDPHLHAASSATSTSLTSSGT